MAQYEFTIELRCEFADPERSNAMDTVVKRTVRHLIAQAALLSDTGVKPDYMVMVNDFYGSHREIDVLDDIITEGEKLAETMPDTEISSELLNALKNG